MYVIIIAVEIPHKDHEILLEGKLHDWNYAYTNFGELYPGSTIEEVEAIIEGK